MVFWVLEWRRQSVITIVDCSYTLCYSTVTTIMMFTRSIKKKNYLPYFIYSYLHIDSGQDFGYTNVITHKRTRI